MSCTWNTDPSAVHAGPAAEQPGSAPRQRGWKPSELVAMIGGFIVFWPLGLAALALKYGWLGLDRWEWGQRQWARLPGTPKSCKGRNSMADGEGPRAQLNLSSGNLAFDGWKAAELARLEQQYAELAASQKAFESFLQQLREARDRETFDRFMANRPAGA
jgi:Protein of unknown function (DUF2852)